MSYSIFEKINELRTDPEVYWYDASVSAQYYVEEYIDYGYMDELIWSNALSLAALDYLNFGELNEFNSITDAALNWYAISICDSYEEFAYHSLNNATAWNV